VGLTALHLCLWVPLATAEGPCLQLGCVVVPQHTHAQLLCSGSADALVITMIDVIATAVAYMHGCQVHRHRLLLQPS
jgi:hypothetical protein